LWLAILAVLVVAYAVLLEVARLKAYPNSVSALVSGGLWSGLYRFLTFVCLGPVAEELCFRGWLWTGLKRHWPTLPTAAVTSFIWVIFHQSEYGIARPVLVIPMAIALSMARHLGRSVRAPIALHVIYNFAIETSLPILREVELL
jgi:membrane protease YdiL (CAAX protease family)